MFLPIQLPPVDRSSVDRSPMQRDRLLSRGISPAELVCCCAPGLGPPACAFDADTCVSLFGGFPCPGQCRSTQCW